MLLRYRFKRPLYLSWYISFQGNISVGPQNELVLRLSESINLCIGCWEVQLAIHGVCMYHISCDPNVRVGDWFTVQYTLRIDHARGNLNLECSFGYRHEQLATGRSRDRVHWELLERLFLIDRPRATRNG